MIRSSQTVPHGSGVGPAILKTLAPGAHAETPQQCAVPIFGEAVRLQRRKPLDHFTKFEAHCRRDGLV